MNGAWQPNGAAVDVMTDGRGRIIDYQTAGLRRAMQWDVEGRMLTMDRFDLANGGAAVGRAVHTYNAADQRLTRDHDGDGSVDLNYLWEGDGLLSEQVAGNGVVRTHVRGAGLTLGDSLRSWGARFGFGWLLDNNATERGIRGIAIGRRVHFGSKSRRGTQVAAIYYSLVESAKLAGVDPAGYIKAAVIAARNGFALLPGGYREYLAQQSQIVDEAASE